MYLPKITLIPKLHRGTWFLFVEFGYNKELTNQLHMMNALWSASNKSWYVPYTTKNIAKLHAVFTGKAVIDDSAIPKKQSVAAIVPVKKPVTIPEAYLKTLAARRFSESTCKTYTSLFLKYMEYYRDQDLDTLTKDQITDYLLHLIKTKNISSSTQNQVINAIKFYYEKVLNRETEKYWIDRPQREFKLPTVLSEQEVMALFGAIKNLKHLTIVSLLYSAGLRRGEILRIKKGDVDMNRNQIKVVAAKGKKDRMTILSTYMANLLTDYVKVFKPTYWLFEGPQRKQYSASSIATIIKKATKAAKIPKHVTPHVLRHSFATHLMDQGIEIRYIQTLLGHNSIETTTIYTHVSTRNLAQIKSPLDTILEKRAINNGHIPLT